MQGVAKQRERERERERERKREREKEIISSAHSKPAPHSEHHSEIGPRLLMNKN